MKKVSYLVLLFVSAVVFLACLSLVFPKSSNPCASCHSSYDQYLDILEGDNSNSLPLTIEVGETKTIKVTIQNYCNAPLFSTMSRVSVTLMSQNGRFSVESAIYNVGSLPVGKATAVWNATGVSSGTDTLLIAASATNSHNGLSFSDSYDPSPSIAIVQDSPPPPPTPALVVYISSPAGAENWAIGSSHDIMWNASGGIGLSNTNLEYSTTGTNGPWRIIAIENVNDGYYSWVIPETPSANCYVRVTTIDSANPPQNATAVSNSFSIYDAATPPPVLSISISSSIGGNWPVGSTQEIRWNATGGVGILSVQLDYSSTGNTGPWITISAGLPNSGTYSWTVPDSLSESCYLRATVTDSSIPPQSKSRISTDTFRIYSTQRGHFQAPVVIFTVEESQVIANRSITFNATEAFDTNNNSLIYSWNFGDESPVIKSNNPIQAHSFSSEGKYVIVLTISNGHAEAMQTMEINVRKAQANMPPTTTDGRELYFLWVGSFIFLGGIFGVFYSTSGKTKSADSPTSSGCCVVSSSLPTFFLGTEKCVGCGFCAKNCPSKAIFMLKKKPVHDPSRCCSCMRCTKCPREAVIIVPAALHTGD